MPTAAARTTGMIEIGLETGHTPCPAIENSFTGAHQP